ncbi:specific histone demethylase 1 homolog 1 [Seminavis robusta]|uniref:Specific histone demethylase 1 homolog 1 n=1 Tax=Seminavis robusta TaxID=568900 RepID=A0A9N8ECC5_9STRA|nr:specific histone demethylase 1 homolog 1 [Seminavis robusta]|eukprot:Sro748_g196720.1 specific histone demethylase 1 homolog 1 (444) ;mRNA; f:27511-28955
MTKELRFTSATGKAKRLPQLDQQQQEAPLVLLQQSGMESEKKTSPNAHDGVIVIGAGAAGLTAAYDLHRKNIPVQVLEAHPTEFGGRVRKLEGFADFPIDAGGEWIHFHPRILSKIVDDPSFARNDHFEVKPYKFAPFYEFRGGKKWVLKYPRHEENEIVYKFTKGYTWHDFFQNFIAKSLDIQYGCVVQSIDYSTARITVKCRNGRVFFGSQVIVAVSLPILQDDDITFVPQLPPAKKKAIDNVPFGPGLKVFLEFSSQFYHNNFGIQTKKHGERVFYNEMAFQRNPNKRNILAVYVYGDVALKYTHLGDDAIIQRLVEELDGAYKGKASRTYIKGFVQNWTCSEPFIRGAFSSYRKGMKPMWTILQPVDKKIFFAGEHLPPNGADYGYVTGAALSGRNAATAVQCVQKGEKPPFLWKAWMVHVLGTVMFGFEQRLFFNDTD